MKYLWLGLVAVATMGCHGYQDPALMPDGGGNTPPAPEPEEKILAPGVMRIYADKTTIEANGADEVKFRVVLGSEEGNIVVSDGDYNLQISYECDGEKHAMTRFATTFTTSVPGAYSFTAELNHGGQTLTENETSVVALPAADGGTKYYQKVMGVQFTSIWCNSCPTLSKNITTYQTENPGRLVNVSFHENMTQIDPMTTATSEMYFRSFSEQGLPRFYVNLRKGGEKVTSEYSGIVNAVENELQNYPTTCGVAIESQYDASTRELQLVGKITSNTSKVYRYVFMLLEDGIEYMQDGANSDYVHNNVMRQAWPSDSMIGYYAISDGSASTPGEEIRIERKAVTLNAEWNAENVRVFFAALASTDGGTSYTVDNCTECKLGESVDYAYDNAHTTTDQLTLSASATQVAAGETIQFSALLNGEEEVVASTTIVNVTTGERAKEGAYIPTEAGSYEFIAARKGVVSNRLTITVDPSEEPETPVVPGATYNQLRRHILLYEFTGVGCAMCPDGWVTLSAYLQRPKYKDVLHVIAFHSNSMGEDPMHLNLTDQLTREYGNMGLPSCLIDMRVAGEINSLKSQGLFEPTFNEELAEQPAWCGAALESTWDEASRQGKLTARVLINQPGTYRIVPFVVEDGVQYKQKQSNGEYRETYNHRHVVRQMLSTAYTGDLVGRDLKQGDERTVEYNYTLDANWAAEKVELYVALIEETTGYIKNMAYVKLGESCDYDLCE